MVAFVRVVLAARSRSWSSGVETFRNVSLSHVRDHPPYKLRSPGVRVVLSPMGAVTRWTTLVVAGFATGGFKKSEVSRARGRIWYGCSSPTAVAILMMGTSSHSQRRRDIMRGLKAEPVGPG